MAPRRRGPHRRGPLAAAAAAALCAAGSTWPRAAAQTVESESMLWCGGVTHQTANFRVESPTDTNVFVIHRQPPTAGAGFPAAPPPVFRAPVEFGVTAIENAPNPDVLSADTTYYYGLESGARLDPPRFGSFTTMPTPGTPKNFSFGFASCAWTGHDHPVFTEVKRLQDEAEEGESPHLFFVHMGDLFYADIPGTGDAVQDLPDFRAAYRDVWKSPSQGELYRNRPLVYTWDDHDYGPDNSHGGSDSKDGARKAYQMLVPHHPLPAAGDRYSQAGRALDAAIYHAYTAGRVRFIVLDLRSSSEDAEDSSSWAGSSPTMLGAQQKAWLRTELQDYASHGMVVLVSSKPWSGEAETGDCCKWMHYADERRELANMIKDIGVDNLVMIAGDAHMIAYDDGTNTDYAEGGGAGFPLMHSAPMAQVASYKGGPFSHGCYGQEVSVGDWMSSFTKLFTFDIVGSSPDTNQFSVMEIIDDGSRIGFRTQGYRWQESEQAALPLDGAVLEMEAPFVRSASAGEGSCEEKKERDSNKQLAQFLFGLICMLIVILCGMGCQLGFCGRVCCFERRDSKDTDL